MNALAQRSPSWIRWEAVVVVDVPCMMLTRLGMTRLNLALIALCEPSGNAYMGHKVFWVRV